MSNNPANEKPKGALPPGYMPMSMGAMSLEVPEKDGYHRRWFRSDPGRIQRALRAGYRFVEPDEVSLNNFDLGGDASASGNTDLGSRVSIISGDGPDATGQPSRLYLMECPLELYEHSREIIVERNDSIAAALRGDGIGQEGEETSVDRKRRYTNRDQNRLDLFTKKG